MKGITKNFVILFLLTTFVASRTYGAATKTAFLTIKNPRAEVDPENCFFDGQRTCFSCKNAALCVETASGMTAYDEPCYNNGEVCNIAADDVEAACTSTSAIDEPGAACYCNPSLPQPRTEADPYTDKAYLLCDLDTTFYRICYGGYIYNAAYSRCTPVGPTCQYVGIFPFEDDCSFYYICNSVGSQGSVLMCDDDDYFNPNTGKCEPEPDASLTCFDDNSQPITGPVESPIYCSYYYICDNGTFISTEGCPVDTIYSDADNECVPDDGSCISTGYCF